MNVTDKLLPNPGPNLAEYHILKSHMEPTAIQKQAVFYPKFQMGLLNSCAAIQFYFKFKSWLQTVKLNDIIKNNSNNNNKTKRSAVKCSSLLTLSWDVLSFKSACLIFLVHSNFFRLSRWNALREIPVDCPRALRSWLGALTLLCYMSSLRGWHAPPRNASLWGNDIFKIKKAVYKS